MASPPLSQLTTLGVGGPADELVEVTDTITLARALSGAEDAGRPVLVLGGGSNIVVPDAGFPGTVAHIAIVGLRMGAEGDGHMGAGVDGAVVSACAGESWVAVVERCVAEGLSGVEGLSGIPGLVGATPVQNVGAYGQEVSQVITSVTVWDRRARRIEVLSPAECGFAYRHSIFKNSDRYVVTEVNFKLERSVLSQPLAYAEVAALLGAKLGQRAPLSLVAEAVLELRRRKGMLLDTSDPDSRSAGSFFVNPVLTMTEISRLRELAPDVPTWPAPGGAKVSAAWLVEMSGFSKGFSLATASISSKHALALTVRQGGTAADLLALARQVRNGVKEQFGVVLEPEPLLVGAYL